MLSNKQILLHTWGITWYCTWYGTATSLLGASLALGTSLLSTSLDTLLVVGTSLLGT